MEQNDNNTRLSKRYVAIVKLGNHTDGTAHCIKYRFDDLLIFTVFLDKKWQAWKWFNVYSNRGKNKRQQIKNFTNRNQTY